MNLWMQLVDKKLDKQVATGSEVLMLLGAYRSDRA